MEYVENIRCLEECRAQMKMQMFSTQETEQFLVFTRIKVNFLFFYFEQIAEYTLANL